MLRVSAIAENAGIPSASLVCEGFIGQAGSTAVGLGFPNLPVALVPGQVGVQTKEKLDGNVRRVTLDRVIENLTVNPPVAQAVNEPGPKDIVFEGSFEEVNRFFYENEWSDGLPIVPPSPEKIASFLSFTDRSPDEVLGVVLPDNRKVTVWTAAVNGVMAGCRPEYMPILVALGEAMCDPVYGVEHSGNTPGAETLIILNGPIIKELNFNDEQGALRDGFMPNTTVGRFWRLLLRNGAGFLPHKTDKGTFGNTWRVVLAENEAAAAKAGWAPLSVDQGFAAGDNTVTISRFTGSDVVVSVFGNTGEQMLPYLADGIVKQTGWEVIFTVGMSTGMYCPLLVLSPILAETFGKSGWDKARIRDYLYENARIPAWKFEKYIMGWTNFRSGGRSLFDLASLGEAPKAFGVSSDPNRMVPIVGKPEDFMIAVSGDPLRTNAMVFSHNGILGYPTTKKIALPRDWKAKLGKAGGG